MMGKVTGICKEGRERNRRSNESHKTNGLFERNQTTHHTPQQFTQFTQFAQLRPRLDKPFQQAHRQFMKRFTNTTGKREINGALGQKKGKILRDITLCDSRWHTLGRS